MCHYTQKLQFLQKIIKDHLCFKLVFSRCELWHTFLVDEALGVGMDNIGFVTGRGKRLRCK